MKRIVLAMSGGVDSSIAAYLLQRSGWDVIGVTFRMWEGSVPRDAGAASPWRLAAQDAGAVCEQLRIPHHAVDCRDEFQRKVVRPFCEAYLSGTTPNPCVLCNPCVKFRKLLDLAGAMAADAVATGHYAVVEAPADPDKADRFGLRKGKDPGKEQSYVLYRLGQDQLARTRLPLGTWEKPRVRGLARELGIRAHSRPDSQEICFIPDNDYAGFLARAAPDKLRPGRIVDTSGRQVARHRGIHLFTIGQRRGLGVALGEPRYVVRIEPDTATVVIGSKAETMQTDFLVRDVNWIAFDAPAGAFDADVKIRYTHCPARARIEPLDRGTARVCFGEAESAITPGQAAVFYNGDLVLGGGTIDKAPA